MIIDNLRFCLINWYIQVNILHFSRYTVFAYEHWIAWRIGFLRIYTCNIKNKYKTESVYQFVYACFVNSCHTDTKDHADTKDHTDTKYHTETKRSFEPPLSDIVSKGKRLVMKSLGEMTNVVTTQRIATDYLPLCTSSFPKTSFAINLFLKIQTLIIKKTLLWRFNELAIFYNYMICYKPHLIHVPMVDYVDFLP